MMSLASHAQACPLEVNEDPALLSLAWKLQGRNKLQRHTVLIHNVRQTA